MSGNNSMSQKAEQIIEVASRLFSEKGYKATSLRDIGSHATLHKSSLFNYFANKEEILMAVMDKSLNKHMNILNEIANDNRLAGIEKFKLALEKQILVTCRYRDHINVYLTEIMSLSPANREKYNKKRKEYESCFERIVKEAQADDRSGLVKGLDPKIVKLGVLGMCNWMIKWYHDDGVLRPEEIFEVFYRLLTHRKADE